MSTRSEPWPAGTPCWTDLSTSDPAAAREFYAALFGWDLQVGPPETGEYAMALKHGLPVVGVNGMAAQPGQPTTWVVYLATDDAQASVDAAAAAGASVIVPAMDVMTFGRMALVVDPTGAAVGLWQAGSHLGSQVVNEPSAVTWAELMTRDLDAAQDFYRTVFGYDVEAVEMPSAAGRYDTISVGGRVVGGLGEMPVDVPAEMPPFWTVYFGVDDTDDTVARLRSLGGAVLRDPADTPFGRMAVVADPQGAGFVVIRPPDGAGRPGEQPAEAVDRDA